MQLVIQADNATQEHLPQDHWESLVSNLEALSGGLDGDEQRIVSVEEVPLIQAELTYGDILREGHLTHSPRPSLLAITILPPNHKAEQRGRPITPPIPPHPSIVQRRMELLTSDMLTRALTLVSRGQHERAYHLLTETRSILKGLGKGSLPPLPSSAGKSPTSESGSTGGDPQAPHQLDRHSFQTEAYLQHLKLPPSPLSLLSTKTSWRHLMPTWNLPWNGSIILLSSDATRGKLFSRPSA